jgi:hypothetical protein
MFCTTNRHLHNQLPVEVLSGTGVSFSSSLTHEHRDAHAQSYPMEQVAFFSDALIQGQDAAVARRRVAARTRNTHPLYSALATAAAASANAAHPHAELVAEERAMPINAAATGSTHSATAAPTDGSVPASGTAAPALSSAAAHARSGGLPSAGLAAPQTAAAGTAPTTLFQVHCFAPGHLAPVMVAEYKCGLEASLANESMNMMLEGAPLVVGSGFAVPGPMHGVVGHLAQGKDRVMPCAAELGRMT